MFHFVTYAQLYVNGRLKNTYFCLDITNEHDKREVGDLSEHELRQVARMNAELRRNVDAILSNFVRTIFAKN